MEERGLAEILISWLPLLLSLAVVMLIVWRLGQINKNVDRIAKVLEERGDPKV